MTYQIGWLSTGRDQAAIDLLRHVQSRIADGTIPAQIAFVFCNREPGESPASDAFLEHSRGAELPLVCFSSATYDTHLRRLGQTDLAALARWRKQYDERVMGLIGQFELDVVLLAGYMLILSPGMCEGHTILNLHPALPGGPTGTWQDVIWELIATDAERTGAMVHLVTAELDRGPAITYTSFSLRGGVFEKLRTDMRRRLQRSSLEAIRAADGESNPLFSEIRRREAARELPLLVHTLAALARREVTVRGQRVFHRGRETEGGLSLDAVVERETDCLL